MYQKKIAADIRCPLEYGLELFGGKWRSRVICVLAEKEVLRYSGIRKEMSNITDAVLASTLKELINDGLIDRKQYDEIPPRVEYTLTDKGRSVVPILQSICKWSGIFYKGSSENTMTQCERCDYNNDRAGDACSQ
ncbi:MAG: helix-turn-helix domain-containing protein [Eubacteriales bacterium]|nr:helix-turn-helix domain-containing protein [Eubacteriales bacterium]